MQQGTLKKHHKIPSPVTQSSYKLIWLWKTQESAKEMELLSFRELSAASSGTSACFVSENKTRICGYLQKWQHLIKTTKITVAIIGNVPARQGCSFKKCTWKQGFPNQQNGTPFLTVMQNPQCTRWKEKHSKNKQTALNLEHGNVLVSILVEDLLSDIESKVKIM